MLTLFADKKYKQTEHITVDDYSQTRYATSSPLTRNSKH